VLASIGQTLSTDADPASWELQLAPLLLPLGTASARVLLIASEDVIDDTVAPEFDGHYVDNARARVIPPLAIKNADMEDSGDVFDDGSGWETDSFSIVGAENGITPSGGSSMLRFDATMGAAAGSDTGAVASQIIDATDYFGVIAPGTATVHASALFNRVAGGAGTDTQFSIIVQQLDSSGGSSATAFSPYFTDADPGTWELHQASLVLPASTVSVKVLLVAVENVTNDVISPEFDGHYVDEFQLWIEP
jgi:hypothetical protein